MKYIDVLALLIVALIVGVSPLTASGDGTATTAITAATAVVDAGTIAVDTAAPPGPDVAIPDAVGMIGTIVQLIRDGNYPIAAGTILVLLLGLLRRFWNFIPDDWKPYLVSAAAVLSVGSAELVAGHGVLRALYTSVATAAFAVFVWNMLTPLRRRWKWLDNVMRGFMRPPAAKKA